MKKSILFIYNIPAPYRVDFLNLISEHQEIKVFFEKENAAHRNKEWLNNKIHFPYTFINASFKNHIKLLYMIFKTKHIVLGGYSTPLSIFLIIYMKILRKRYILNADGGFLKKESKFNFILKKFLISSATYWLSSGKETNKYLEKYGADTERIYIYPFTSIKKSNIELIDDDQKNNLKLKALGSTKKIVLYVGSFIPIKGVEKLIEAATYCDEFNFLFIGGTPNEQQKQLSKNKENIIFKSHLSKEELKKYYQMADLFVFPTQGDVWGLVINEAQSYGLPIITTDKCIAGLELLESDTGQIIPHDLPNEELASLIEKTFKDIESFDTNKIIKSASRYTLENMSDRHIEIFEEINRGDR